MPLPRQQYTPQAKLSQPTGFDLNRRELPERQTGHSLAQQDFTQTRHLTFHDALIEEIQFPAFDADSKSADTMTVKLDPESVVYDPLSNPATKEILKLVLQTRGMSAEGAKQIVDRGPLSEASDRLRARLLARRHRY